MIACRLKTSSPGVCAHALGSLAMKYNLGSFINTWKGASMGALLCVLCCPAVCADLELQLRTQDFPPLPSMILGASCLCPPGLCILCLLADWWIWNWSLDPHSSQDPVFLQRSALQAQGQGFTLDYCKDLQEIPKAYQDSNKNTHAL